MINHFAVFQCFQRGNIIICQIQPAQITQSTQDTYVADGIVGQTQIIQSAQSTQTTYIADGIV
jgi:hypothetical protein